MGDNISWECQNKQNWTQFLFFLNSLLFLKRRIKIHIIVVDGQDVINLHLYFVAAVVQYCHIKVLMISLKASGENSFIPLQASHQFKRQLLRLLV